MANTFYPQLTLDSSCPSTFIPNYSAHLQHHPRQYQHFYQFSQHPNELQASQQDQPQCFGLVNCPQEESTATLSFWKAFDTVVSDAEGVNEKYGEVEAVYKKRKGDDNEKKSCVEKSGDGGMKRGRKRRKVEKEMGAFLERLVKRVMKQQEGLQKRLMEVIERMEKEREEWEERWRVRETEIQEREAIAKARDRDLASWRDSSIVSTIDKISGQSFLLFSANLSTIHEPSV